MADMLTNRLVARWLTRRSKSACITAAGVWGGSRCLLKNRDRNYIPKVKVIHEIREGVEVLYMKDEGTGWVEGLNEYGIGVVNSALQMARDEAEKRVVKEVGKKSKDGKRILQVLEQKDLDAAVDTACTYKGGVKGHTFVSDAQKTVSIEQTKKHDCKTKTVAQSKIHVRTNHGIQHPDAGYQEDTDDYVSSVYRRDRAKKVLRSVSRPEDLAPALYRKQKGEGESNSMVRKTENMRTSSQFVLDLTKKVARLYLLPGEVEFEGLEVDLPDDYEPKLKLKVYEYEDADSYKDVEAHPVKTASAGLLPIMDPQYNLREVCKQLILLEDHLFHPRKRCMDCIRKHLLTAEALAEEAVTLDVDGTFRGATNGLADKIREAWTMVQNVGQEGAHTYVDIAQAVRKIRKGLVGVCFHVRVAAFLEEADNKGGRHVACPHRVATRTASYLFKIWHADMEKRGSAFEAPPGLLKAYLDWALPLYANNVLWHTQQKLKSLRTRGGPYQKALDELEELKRTWKQRVEQEARWMGDKVVFAVPWPKPDKTIGTYAIGFLNQGPNREGETAYKFDHSPKRVTFRKRRSPWPIDDHIRSVESIIRQATDRITGLLAKSQEGDTDAILVEGVLLAREAKKLATQPKEYATSKSTRLKVDASLLRDWKYRNKLPSDGEINATLASGAWDQIKVKLFFRPHSTRGGVWKPAQRELEVDVKVFQGLTIPNNVAQYRAGLDWIRSVARHEMQHVGQTLFGVLQNAGEARGLPSQHMRDPSKDPYGYHRQNPSPHFRDPHGLQDVEFYTNLEDEIEKFVTLSRKIPLNRRREALKVWTGSTPQRFIQKREFGVLIERRRFFSDLLIGNKAKWKKAVGEFVKGVGQKGINIPRGRLAFDGHEYRRKQVVMVGPYDDGSYKKGIIWSNPSLRETLDDQVLVKIRGEGIEWMDPDNLIAEDEWNADNGPWPARVAAKYKDKKKVKTQDGGETTVYEYSEGQVAHRNREKAKRVEALRKSIGKLRAQVKKDLGSKDATTRLSALAVALLDETYERVGNDTSAKDGHFGVTGWKVEHVTFKGSTATFKYVGKSGVDQTKKVTNPQVVMALKACCEGKSKGDNILCEEDGTCRVTSTQVNSYLKPFGVTAKDVRGLHANEEMRSELKKARKGKLPDDKKEREKKLKDEFKAALEAAAAAVGHEPSTLKSQYLVPGLEDAYLKDGTLPDSLSKTGTYRERQPPLGPNTPLMEESSNKVKYRVRASRDGVALAVYYGRKKIGGMNGTAVTRWWVEDCASDVEALVGEYPQLEGDRGPNMLRVFKAFITDETKRGLGIGKAMYQALMVEWFNRVGPFLFMPMACSGSGTSPMARRVWASLARQYPSSGEVVAVLRRPQLPSELKTAATYDPSHPETVAWVKGFYSRHPNLRRFSSLPVVHVEKPGGGRHPEASWSHGNIELYPKFRQLPAGIQDFVFAHEIGHAVLSQWGSRNLMVVANGAGVDPWDTLNLPFGQFNFDEAFADCFASYHIDGDVKRRYPGWTQIVKAALQQVRMATKSRTEKEDEDTANLIRKQPKKKPPRKDLHKRRLDDHDEDEDGDAKQDRKDQSQNYKDGSVEAAWRALRTRVAREFTKKEWESYKKDHPGADKSKHTIVEPDAKGKGEDDDGGGDDDDGGGDEEREEAAKDQAERVKDLEERKKDEAIEARMGEVKELVKDLLDTDSSGESELPRDLQTKMEKRLRTMNPKEREEYAKSMAAAIAEYPKDPPMNAEAIEEGREALGADIPEMSPKEAGKSMAAALYARRVTFNPLMLGRQPVTDDVDPATEKELAKGDKERRERASQAYGYYAQMDGDERNEAITQCDDALRSLDADSPRARELRAIRDGIGLAAVIEGEEPDGIQVSEQFVQLAIAMKRVGEETRFLGTVDDPSSVETQDAVQKALGTMTDQELVDMVGGVDSDSPLAPLAKVLMERKPDGTYRLSKADREQMRKMIEEAILEDISLLDPMVSDYLRENGLPNSRKDRKEYIKKKTREVNDKTGRDLRDFMSSGPTGPDHEDRDSTKEMKKQLQKGNRDRRDAVIKGSEDDFEKKPQTANVAVGDAVLNEGNTDAMKSRRVDSDGKTKQPEIPEKKDKGHNPGDVWGKDGEWFAMTPEGNVVGPIKDREKAQGWADGDVGGKSKKAAIPGYDLTPWPAFPSRR